MSNRAVTYTLNLNNNVISSLEQTEAYAQKLDATMSGLQSTMIGLGELYVAKMGYDWAKEWVQGAADYEQATLRIKFGSLNLREGLINQSFIAGEADKFKIPIQDATEAYGAFLAQVRSSGLAGSEVRKLHDEILLIGKVLHLPDNMMNQAVGNLGKMLESSRIDARHIWPFVRELSGIEPYIAKEMGITPQKFAEFASHGGFAKQNVDPKIILNAIEEYSKQFAGNLNEATSSMQSGINDVSNDWLKFKNSIVDKLKPELTDFFAEIKKGIGWLRDHEDSLIRWGHYILDTAEFLIKLKIAYSTVSLIQGTFASAISGYTSKTTMQTAAYEEQTVAVNQLAIAMERVAYASEVMAGASISGVVGLGASGIPLASAGAGSAISEGMGMAGAIGAAVPEVIAGALAVYIVASSIEALGNYITFHNKYNNESLQGQYRMDYEKTLENVKSINSLWAEIGMSPEDRKRIITGSPSGDSNEDYSIKDLITRHPEFLSDQSKIDEIRTIIDRTKDLSLIQEAKELGLYHDGERIRVVNEQKNIFLDKMEDLFKGLDNIRFGAYVINTPGYSGPLYPTPNFQPIPESSYTKHNKVVPPKIADTSHLKGNTVTNITITIPEMNGMKQCTFQVRNMKDMEKIEDTVGAIMIKHLTSAVNDSQHVGRQH